MSALVSAQLITVLNFEDEDETAEIIDHLQKIGKPSHTRNTFALNPKR